MKNQINFLQDGSLGKPLTDKDVPIPGSRAGSHQHDKFLHVLKSSIIVTLEVGFDFFKTGNSFKDSDPESKVNSLKTKNSFSVGVGMGV